MIDDEAALIDLVWIDSLLRREHEIAIPLRDLEKGYLAL